MILPGWKAGWLDVGSERDVFRQLGDSVICFTNDADDAGDGGLRVSLV